MLFFNVSNCSERTSSHEDSHLSNSTEQREERGEATRPKLCGHLQKCWLILIQENPEGCAGVTCRNGFWWENCQQAGQKLTYRRLVTQLHQVFYINPWEINQKVEKNQNCSLVFWIRKWIIQWFWFLLCHSVNAEDFSFTFCIHWADGFIGNTAVRQKS